MGKEIESAEVSAKITKGKNTLTLDAYSDEILRIEVNGSEAISLSEPAINSIQEFLFKRWCYNNKFTYLSDGDYTKNNHIVSKEKVIQMFKEKIKL